MRLRTAVGGLTGSWQAGQEVGVPWRPQMGHTALASRKGSEAAFANHREANLRCC